MVVVIGGCSADVYLVVVVIVSRITGWGSDLCSWSVRFLLLVGLLGYFTTLSCTSRFPR